MASVGQARAVVHRVLVDWCAESIFDDVALVASELVANALRHGLQVDPLGSIQPGADAGAGRDDNGGVKTGAVRISLVSTGSHVICAVTDPSRQPPVRRPAEPFAASGRGLQLVESLSLCWGWTALDDVVDGRYVGAVTGKSVWAIFPLSLAGSVRAAGAA
jgi:anti-sigma regulatory factor (Ser/Thr protein kinase)